MDASTTRRMPLHRPDVNVRVWHTRRILLCLGVFVVLGAAMSIFLSMRFAVSAVGRAPGVFWDSGARGGTPPVCCTHGSTWRFVSNDNSSASQYGDAAAVRHRIGFVTSAAGLQTNSLVPRLWQSIRKHAFPEHEVHMYVFTDSPEPDEYSGRERVHVRHAVALVPPFDVLGRHALYLANFDWFGDLDYVFAIDARTLVVAPLDEAMLGERVASLSARHVRLARRALEYDRRVTLDSTPFSSAYVGEFEGGCYFAGELFGGTPRGFGQILEHSVQLTKTDLEAMPPRAASLLDESYLNRVFIDLPPTVVLAHNYMFPEEMLPELRAPVTAGIVDGRFFPRIVKLRRDFERVCEPRAVPVPRFLLQSFSAARQLQLQPFIEPHRISSVTFIVRAFERPQCLKELLVSVSSRFAGVAVVVLDDSKSALMTADDVHALRYWNSLNLTYVRAEFDIGASEARNRLVGMVDTEYAVVLPDTMVLDSASDVQHLVSMLDATGGDFVGGCLGNPPLAYGGYFFTAFNSVLWQTGDVSCNRAVAAPRRPDYTTPAVSCWSVDMPLEFYVGRVSSLRRLRWDSSVGPHGHEDYFMQAKAAGARVSVCPGVTARFDNAESDAPRGRSDGPGTVQDEWASFLKKWQLTEVRTPVASIKLLCEPSGALPCETETTAPVDLPLETPRATDVQCCGDSSPWVCATGGWSTGNVSVSARWSRYTRLHVGFVTYATGPYNDFVRDLWKSIQEHAFTRHDVHLFVFTDKPALFDGQQNIHTRHQDRVGWPFDSLGRHFLYLDNIEWFSSVDYVLSIDSDALVVGTLDESMLGERVACLNAWYFGLQRHEYTYETRLSHAGTPVSRAYIGKSEGQCYFAGGVFGGSVRGFRDILERTVALAQSDLNARPPRVAIWHDESYLNRVFIDVPPTVVLAPNFMYPEPPVDAWLYVQAPSAAAAWSTPPDRSHRFSPRILNLGVRKHVEKSMDVYQPLNAVIPAFMTASGVPGTLPLPIVGGQRLSEITFIVKAFERPLCLRRLLKSVGDVYRGANVVVLDDSKQPLLSRDEAAALGQQHGLNFTYVTTEYDIGLSAGRNRLVDLVTTPYAALLDDDSVLNGAENVLHLITVLEAGGFDLAGGCVQNPRYGHGWSYSLRLEGDRLVQQPDVSCTPGETARRPPDFDTPEVSCWKVDFILNFFVGRVAALRGSVRWDPRLKLGEHEDFFMRAQQGGLSIAMCRGVTVMNDHSCDTSTTYSNSRARVFDYWVVFFDTWGLREMQTAAGIYSLKCVALSGGSSAVATVAASPACTIVIS